MSLAEIETRVKVYADARQLLSERVAALKAGIDALHKEHLPGIKRSLQRVAEIDSQARVLIETQPDLFVKPRTLVMHGTKVGFEKGKGAISFDGKPEAVVKRIEKLLPEQADLLIHLEKKPNKEGLAKLPATDLKKLGCSISGGGDQVVLKPVDGAVDKMVKALLKSATDDADQAAQADQAEEAEQS